MNATMTRLNGFKVAELKSMAKEMGFRFISRKRKAELVELIAAHIEWLHAEAIREDKIRTRQSAPRVSLIDFPVVDGRPVTEAHVKICADRGHATHVVNGVDSGFCPRCGEWNEDVIARAIEQEKALAQVEPFDSPIALCKDEAKAPEFDVDAYINSEPCEPKHIANGEIKIGGFWECCNERPAMVVVFDNGYRQAVCERDAKSYAGTVENLPNGTDRKCERCGETFRTPAAEDTQNRQAMANMIMGNSDPIEDVVRFAQESIDALMPTLEATKAAFESLRDDESANPNHVDLAYQVYSDTHRAIEEYKRTIAYARS
jgi:hypothetical protein